MNAIQTTNTTDTQDLVSLIDGKALDSATDNAALSSVRFTDLNWVGGGTAYIW